MEGVASEAASLAGHLRLGKLIYLYDNNHISLAAATDLTFTEDVARRFQAYRWQTIVVEDGNDLSAIDAALREAQGEADRPSLILVRTHIGYGSPHKQDTFDAHGSPLGEDEVKETKRKLGWPLEPAFYIPPQVLDHFRRAIAAAGRPRRSRPRVSRPTRRHSPSWPGNSKARCGATCRRAGTILSRSSPPTRRGWPRGSPRAKCSTPSPRKVPALIGGSADLDPSTMTALPGLGDFLPARRATSDIRNQQSEIRNQEWPQGSVGGGWSYAGRNLHFGVREHAMGSILNGLAAHGATIPYGATFLIFSDYMRPRFVSPRSMGLHVVYVFTHDSIGLGEDGPTHQSVEQLASLRAIPHLVVIRPGDANEAAVAWRVAMEFRDRPVALALSRQKRPDARPDAIGFRRWVAAGSLRFGRLP